MEEDDYKLQYTITSAPFRKLYFSGVRMTEETSKAVEIYHPNESWSVEKGS